MSNFFKTIYFRIAASFVLITILTFGLVEIFFVLIYRQQAFQNIDTTLNLPNNIRTDISLTLSTSQDTQEANNKIYNTLLSSDDNNDKISFFVLDTQSIIRGSSTVKQQPLVGTKFTEETINNEVTQLLEEKVSSTDITKTISTNGKQYRYRFSQLASSDEGSKKITGILVAVTDLDAANKDITNIQNILVSAFLIPIVITAIVAYWISRRITQPIRKLTLQTEEIANGNYLTRNNIQRNDEIGRLGQSLDQLAQNVEIANENLLSDRNRLDAILTNMTDGILVINRFGEITIVNPSTAIFLDQLPDNLLGKNILDELKIADRFTLRELLSQKEVFFVDLSNEANDLTVSVYASLMRQTNGYIVGAVLVLHDVTQQQKNEIERKQFVSNVSHELRTPLTTINSYTETLLDGAMSSKKITKNFLEVIQNESNRMTRMVSDLLELSRIDQNTFKFNLSTENIVSYINGLLDRFEVIVKNLDEKLKKYSIKNDIKKTNQDLFVSIDTDRLNQVIDNVISNAIKYSPDGGEITVSLEQKKQNVIISVSDQGLGIPKKDINKVFDRFYRVDKARSRAQGGSGLGLAISKEVIDALGGRIWIESQEQKGTTVFISLPIIENTEK